MEESGQQQAPAPPPGPSGEARPFWGPWRTVPLLVLGLVLIGYGGNGLFQAAQNLPAIRQGKQAKVEALDAELTPIKEAFAQAVFRVVQEEASTRPDAAWSAKRAERYILTGSSGDESNPKEQQRIARLLSEMHRISSQIGSLKSDLKSSEESAHHWSPFALSLLAGLAIVAFLCHLQFRRRRPEGRPGANAQGR